MKTTYKKKLSTTAKETTNSTSNSKQLTEQKKIPDTPFTAVRIENKWFLSLGKYRLTGQLNTYNQCIQATKDASWERIMQIMQIMIDENKQQIIRETLEELVRDHSTPPEINKSFEHKNTIN